MKDKGFIDDIMEQLSPYLEDDDYVYFEMRFFTTIPTSEDSPAIAIWTGDMHGPSRGLPTARFRCKKRTFQKNLMNRSATNET